MARPQRQSLHLSIDPSPYHPDPVQLSPEDSSASSSEPSSSLATSRTTSADYESVYDYQFNIIYSVLCLYDFETNDPEQLPFHKNEILDVVAKEETGWWAAIARDKSKVGWIPRAYVQPLSSEMAQRLRSVREEIRVFEYEAEQLYNSAPISRIHGIYDQESPSYRDYEWSTRNQGSKPPSRSNTMPSTNTLMSPRHRDEMDAYSISDSPSPRPRPYPQSPSTPMPQPPAKGFNKPTPPTPVAQTSDTPSDLQRSDSTSRHMRRRVMLVDDQGSLNRLSTFIESTQDRLNSPDVVKARADKIIKITGSEEAVVYLNQIQAQAILPWYLQPEFADQLQLDPEGHIRSGTLNALLEKLYSEPPTKDPTALAQDNLFRNIFLMTFRTFATADTLFEMLVERYRMDHPTKLNATEFVDWREKKLLPTQKRILMIFTVWLEDHRLLEEEPHIARRLTEFLSLIASPQPLAITAKLIIQSIKRLTFASPLNLNSPVASPRKRRKSKAHKNELLKLDPTDIAEQLCLHEHKLYAKISPQECIIWGKMKQADKLSGNLSAFCATHDKLASWVKMSILNNEFLGKRADTVDFWIKVAEKCRNLNNFASMSAVINALSSTVITRLPLTWAHVGRKSNLDALLKHNEPTGGFSGYRTLLQSVEGSCVPFVGMYLTDIVHIHDQFSDETSVTPTNPSEMIISFLKRQRWYEVVSVMLRYQLKPFNIAESDSTRGFIESHLRSASMKDQTWFWERSQEVQQSELAHVDIRKGLVEAGF